MKGAKRNRRNCIVFLLTLSALGAASVFGQIVPEPIREKARFDVRGRPSSERIILKLTRDAGRRLNGARAVRHAEGAAPVESVLRQKVQDALQQWNSQRVRRVYSFKFAHPESAAMFGLDRYYMVEVPQGTNTTMMAEQFRQLGGDIESASISTIGGIAQTIPSDPDFALQYAMNNTGQTYGPFGESGTFDSDIDAPEAWEIHTGSLGTVTLAIIDSGVGPHPDLDDRMVPGANMQEATQCDGGPFDGLPCSGDEDCMGGVCSPSMLTIDENGHGTAVAGIAAAIGNNGIGIAGVTWGAYIMPIRVVDAGGFGEPGHAFTGLIWAVDHGAQICNLSLQYFFITDQETAMFQAAADYAHANNVLVVAAAGNAAALGGEVTVPGSLTHSLTVSATDDSDSFANTYSSFGPEVDVSAPGSVIYSTLPPNTYGYNTGTSFSCSHVSGLAALIKSHAFDLKSDDIANIIKSTADDKGVMGRDDLYGYGRINAAAALAAAASEACCFGDNTCQMIDPPHCVDKDGTPQGAGSTCGGTEACCDSATGACYPADRTCCLANGDTPNGPGSVCTATAACCLTGTCEVLDPLCCLVVRGGVAQAPGSACGECGSCCLADEDCLDDVVDGTCAAIGGSFNGADTICLGDSDGDGIEDLCDDNCPDDFNPDQEDCDGDGEGDACEANTADQDDDGDGACNGVDNCPILPNSDQSDKDGDGLGDVCDSCPNAPADDSDGDGVCDNDDICQGFDDNVDSDGDGVPDGCDRCSDSDDNAPGALGDDDGDGVINCLDQCNGVDDAVFASECKSAIPTTSQWGLIVLTLLLLVGIKMICFGRRV